MRPVRWVLTTLGVFSRNLPGPWNSAVRPGTPDSLPCRHDVNWLTGVAVSSSVLTIAVLSADRLLAVRRPLSFRVYRASRHAWIIVAGVWATSLAVAAPLLGVRRLRIVDLGFGTQNKLTFCHEASHC